MRGTTLFGFAAGLAVILIIAFLPGMAIAETGVTFKYALTGGNLGQGQTIGFGITATEYPDASFWDNPGKIFKVEVSYTDFGNFGVGNGASIHNTASRWPDNHSVFLGKTAKEGALRIGFGGALKKGKFAYFTAEVVVGSLEGTTTAEYLSEIYHKAYRDDDGYYHPAYYEYKTGAKTFVENPTYWGGGIGLETELFLTQNLALNIEAMAGGISMATTTFAGYGGENDNPREDKEDYGQPYYRGRFGLLVRF